jgi:hypothetical protein
VFELLGTLVLLAGLLYLFARHIVVLAFLAMIGVPIVAAVTYVLGALR